MIKQIIVLHPTLNAAGGGEKVALRIIYALSKKNLKVNLYTVVKTDWKKIEKVFTDFQKPSKECYLFEKAPRSGSDFLDSIIMTLSFIFLLIYTRITHNELQINTCGEKVNAVSDIVYINAIPLRSAYALKATKRSRKIISLFYNVIVSKLDCLMPTNILISNSNFNRELVKRTYNQETLVIYPPIDLSSIKINTFKKKNRVVIVTRYLPEQGLEIVPELVYNLKELDFILIGPSSEASVGIIKDLVNNCNALGILDRIKILCNQSFSTYLKTLYSSSVILRTLPSEPFGISVIEAMASGCIPVVRKDSGAWLDILEKRDGLYGFGFNSVDEATVKIRRVFLNEKLCQSMQKRVISRASYFSSLDFDERIISIVEKIVKSYSIKFCTR